MNIGKIIKDKRKACGWSLQNLADRAGSSKTYIWQIEKQKGHKISLDFALRLADAFAMTMDEFLTPETTPSKTLVMACDLLRHLKQKDCQKGGKESG